MGSVWRFPVCGGNKRLKDESGRKLHSTQKPFVLLHRIINLCTNPGDIVLDPFGGTFTTGAAGVLSALKEKKYCEYGNKRLEACLPDIDQIEQAIFDIRPEKIILGKLLASGFLYGRDLCTLNQGSRKQPY